MYSAAPRNPALHATLVGLTALAVAIGIGRFAFTPMLPLMQSDGLISLQEGSYLASGNYVGYLLGALLCFAINPPAVSALRFGLLAVAVSTLGMAAANSFPGWLVLRLIAGVASAFVLVGVSEWALTTLAAYQRTSWSGRVFTGVGIGISVAGLSVIAISVIKVGSVVGWLVLGTASLVVAATVWRVQGNVDAPQPVLQGHARSRFDRNAWRLIACYGVFGFGYIVPATFLPAAARALIDDPAVFGWTWPAFGLAAAVSTLAAAATAGKIAPVYYWAAAQLVMAFGVALPAFNATLFSMMVSAGCVGGTFMVITMAAMQEARRALGGSASRLMAAMTAAFALGQLAAPLTVNATKLASEAIRVPSLLAAALLVLSSLALLPQSNTATPTDRRSK